MFLDLFLSFLDAGAGIESFGGVFAGDVSGPNSGFGLDDFVDQVALSADVVDNPYRFIGIDGEADSVEQINLLAVAGVSVHGEIFVVGVGVGLFFGRSGFVDDGFGGEGDGGFG